MSESAKKNDSQTPRMAGSELGPLRGGHWREIRHEELNRRHLFGRAAAPPTNETAENRSANKNESATEVDAEAKDAVSASDPSPSEPSVPYLEQPSSSQAASQGSSEQPQAFGSVPSSGSRVVRLERRQELEHHIKGSPTDLDAYMELGRIYRAEDRPADARRVFQQAIQIFPEEQELLWEHEEAILARSLQQLREVTDVARRLDTAEADRELRRCQNDWACRRMDVCRARLKRDPALHHLRVVLAEAMYDAGLYEGAIQELQPVIDVDEFSPSAHLLRGRCLLEMGKELEAMASLRAASLRRSVVAPVRVRVMALKLLCETAERVGVTLTLAQYRQQLQRAEKELAELANRGQQGAGRTATSNEDKA